ncbi:MAG: M35 family metallo-endopeptidase [Microcoleus sp.]
MRLDRSILLKTLNGGDKKELMDDIEQCFKRLETDLGLMVASLSNLEVAAPLRDPLRDRLKWIFGSDAAATIDQVKNKIEQMLKVIQRPISLSLKWADSQGPNVYAHVYNDVNPLIAGNLFIYLDERYKVKEENSLNNRYLTLVHEFSHLAAQTKDYRYDPNIFWDDAARNQGNLGKCIQPSQTLDYTTQQAVQNADCYGFLMAATYARMPTCQFP